MKPIVGLLAGTLLLGAASGASAQSADVSITMNNGTTTTARTTNTTYTITVSNMGPNSAANLMVQDTLPGSLSFVSIVPNAWTCTTPSVGSAGTVTCTLSALASNAAASFTVTANLSEFAGGTLSNTATVTSSTSDPSPGNNSATDTDAVVAAPAPAPPPAPVPTLGEWALILFGLLLAGGAALHLSRRRLAA